MAKGSGHGSDSGWDRCGGMDRRATGCRRVSTGTAFLATRPCATVMTATPQSRETAETGAPVRPQRLSASSRRPRTLPDCIWSSLNGFGIGLATRDDASARWPYRCAKSEDGRQVAPARRPARRALPRRPALDRPRAAIHARTSPCGTHPPEHPGLRWLHPRPAGCAGIAETECPLAPMRARGAQSRLSGSAGAGVGFSHPV